MRNNKEIFLNISLALPQNKQPRSEERIMYSLFFCKCGLVANVLLQPCCCWGVIVFIKWHFELQIQSHGVPGSHEKCLVCYFRLCLITFQYVINRSVCLLLPDIAYIIDGLIMSLICFILSGMWLSLDLWFIFTKFCLVKHLNISSQFVCT